MSRPLTKMAIEEVRALHAFFVDWFRAGPSHPDFSELERALAPGFSMVTPEGLAKDRKAVVEGIRRAKGTRSADFTIAIFAPRPLYEAADAVLLEYIEQQYRGGRTTRRLSTALFTPEKSAPRGVLWRHLHETWMQEEHGETSELEGRVA